MNEKNEDEVRDLNLEARIDKELLLHGFRRRDFSEEELNVLRTRLDALTNVETAVPEDFWRTHIERHNKPDKIDQKPTPRFDVGDRVWVTQHIAINGVPGVGYGRKVEMGGLGRDPQRLLGNFLPTEEHAHTLHRGCRLCYRDRGISGNGRRLPSWSHQAGQHLLPQDEGLGDEHHYQGTACQFHRLRLSGLLIDGAPARDGIAWDFDR